MLEQEEKVKQANETTLDLLASLRQADAEIEELKKKVA